MQELFDIVDDDNNIIGTATRKEAHEKGFLHKSGIFFIFNKKGQLFMNRRSLKKEFEPGVFSLVLGGHVIKGDSYEQTVIREAKEEAGITSKPHYLANFKSRFKEKDKENAALYYFIIDHEPILDKTERESGRFIDIDEIQRMVKIGHFIRETQVIYPLLLENKEKILKALAKHP